MLDSLLDAEWYVDFNWKTVPLNNAGYPVGTGLFYSSFMIWLSVLWSRKLNIWVIQLFHNLFLSALSLVMFGGTAYELYRRYITEQSHEFIFCEHRTESTGPLFFWSYIFYLSKYYELLDTVLQLLKGRKPTWFKLGVYHHSVVLLMAYNWLKYQQSSQFIGILFNTFVHVWMYLYYGLAVLGYKPWWKNYLTILQILQFAFSFGCAYITLTKIFMEKKDCSGAEAFYFNCAFNATLFWAFIQVSQYNSHQTKLKMKKA